MTSIMSTYSNDILNCEKAFFRLKDQVLCIGQNESAMLNNRQDHMKLFLKSVRQFLFVF